jgi:hypothetical protein
MSEPDQVEEEVPTEEPAQPLTAEILEAPERPIGAEPEPDTARLTAEVKKILSVDQPTASHLVAEAKRLYIDRMTKRFSELKVAERLKRTNPFLLQIRGARTVREWAMLQIQSALYASEEEAVGHLLEAIAKACYPGARTPTHPDDFDFEVTGADDTIYGYQVKMSWNCMPMSSRKNLSNTIRRVTDEYAKTGQQFVGYFAPCYGRAKTSQAPGQDYVSLASRNFWRQVGSGDKDFDVKVGQVCALLCSEFRTEVLNTLVPTLQEDLTAAAQPQIGDASGNLDYLKLFRRVNK